MPLSRFLYRDWCDQEQALSLKSAKKDRQKERNSKYVCVCVCVCQTQNAGRKLKKKTVQERVEDRKVHLIERRLDLGCVWIIWLCEGPRTFYMRLFPFTQKYFFLQIKRHFGNLLTLSSGQRVKRSLNIQWTKIQFFNGCLRNKTSVTSSLFYINGMEMNAWPVTSSYTIVPPSGINGEICQGQGRKA